MLLAECPIISCSIYPICKNPFQIVSDSPIISINSILQAGAFIVDIKGYVFNPCVTIHINTKILLCAKLYRCLYLSSHNWSDLRLSDTHNPVLYLVNLVIVHVLLLLIKFEDGKYRRNILLSW